MLQKKMFTNLFLVSIKSILYRSRHWVVMPLSEELLSVLQETFSRQRVEIVCWNKVQQLDWCHVPAAQP